MSLPLVESTLRALAALPMESGYPGQDSYLATCLVRQLEAIEGRGIRGFMRDLAEVLKLLEAHALERCVVREIVRRGSSPIGGAQRILSSYEEEGAHYAVIVYCSAIMRRWEAKTEWAISLRRSVEAVMATSPDDALDTSRFLIDCCRPFVLRSLLADKVCGQLLRDSLTSADQESISNTHRLLWNFAVSGAVLGEKQEYYLPWPEASTDPRGFAALDAVLREKSAAAKVALARSLSNGDPDWTSFQAIETDLLVLRLYACWLAESALPEAMISMLAGRGDAFETLKLFRWGFGGQGKTGLTFLHALFSKLAVGCQLEVEMLGLSAEMGLINDLAKAKDAVERIRQAGFDENSYLLFDLLSGLIKNDHLDVAASLCREEEEFLFTHPQGARSAADVYVAARDWERAGQAWSALANLSRRGHWSSVNAYRSFARAGNEDAAQRIKESIDFADEDYVPTYPSIANSACSIGDFAFAREVIERAKGHLPSYNKERLESLAIAQMQSSGDLDLTPKPTAAPRPASSPPKALVIDPGFHYRSGHHFNYGKFSVDFLSTELGADPDDVWLLIGGEEKAHDDHSLDGSIRPTFRFGPYIHKDVAVTEESIENLNRAFFRDLCAFSDDLDLSACQAIYVHSMRANMILGFSRWIIKTFGAKPVIVIVGVIEVDYLIEPVGQRKLWARVNKKGLSKLHNAPNVQALLYCETERAWAHFRRILKPDVPINRFPYLAASLAGRIGSSKGTALRRQKITFGTLGASTPNRGSDLFPQLVGLFADVAEVDWVLQLSRGFVEGLGSDHVNHLEYAVERGKCVWFDDRLSVEDYYAAMRRIDVMVLPYRDRYAVSGSGVFYEAIQLERFLVVPKQTFMEGVVRELNYPSRMLPEVSLEALATSVESVVKEREKNLRRIKRFGREGRERLPIGQFRDLFRQGLAAVRSDSH